MTGYLVLVRFAKDYLTLALCEDEEKATAVAKAVDQQQLDSSASVLGIAEANASEVISIDLVRFANGRPVEYRHDVDLGD